MSLLRLQATKQPQHDWQPLDDGKSMQLLRVLCLPVDPASGGSCVQE